MQELLKAIEPEATLVLHNRPIKFGPAVLAALEILDCQQIDVVRGPVAFSVMGIQPDFVMTAEAWPHTDPSWTGMHFFNLTLQGRGYSFGSISKPDEVVTSVGDVFELDPAELHWLRPDVLLSGDLHWVGLQWTVEFENLTEFRQALAKQLGIWSNPDFELDFSGPIVKL